MTCARVYVCVYIFMFKDACTKQLVIRSFRRTSCCTRFAAVEGCSLRKEVCFVYGTSSMEDEHTHM